MSKLKIAVVGGGAAGIFAALGAADSAEVCIYEKNDRIGKKILATGNGRCNLTNINASKEAYHGRNVDFMTHAIDTFWVDETLSYFSDMGLLYKTEEKGKVYPYSNAAASVLDVLRKELERKDVQIIYDFNTEKIKKHKSGFMLEAYDGKSVYADRVIVTAGGKACPSSGSNGGGYEILQRLGHTLTDIFPSLVQVKLKTDMLKALNGIKIDGRVSVKEGKRLLQSEDGEILFAGYGLSGPAVFALSRLVGERKCCNIEIDMMPEYGYSEIYELLRQNKARMSQAEELFCGILPRRIGQVLIKQATPVKMNSDIRNICDSELKKIAQYTKALSVQTDGTLSWNNAQVTAGGIKTSEFDPKTMQSRLQKGLYAAGEILDIDGDCGGYNLQWAWSSGYIAGKSAAGG